MERYHYRNRQGQGNRRGACCGRETRYVAAVYSAILKLGHATNNDILTELSAEFPNLSATTVHRITARLLERDRIKLVPSGPNLERRFDARPDHHDHFKCEACGEIRDIKIDPELRAQIGRALGGTCKIFGDLTVAGFCHNCHDYENNKIRRKFENNSL